MAMVWVKSTRLLTLRYVTTNQTFQHVKSPSSSSTIYQHLNRDIVQLNRPPPNKNIPGNKKNRSTNTAPRHRHRTQYPHQVQTKQIKQNIAASAGAKLCIFDPAHKSNVFSPKERNFIYYMLLSSYCLMLWRCVSGC